jgi:signal transduction histidine kinase
MYPNNLLCYYGDGKINDGIICKQCSFCKHNIVDVTKKCKKFYNSINLFKEDFIKCPYGFYVYIINDYIFNGIVLKNDINSKVKNNLNSEFKCYPKYDIDEVKKLINYNLEQFLQNNKYRTAIHDLRNMATTFNAIVDKYKEEKDDPQYTYTDAELSLLSSYELFNLRLDVLNGIVDLNTVICSKQKLHPIVKKITHMLNYDAHKKQVSIKISAEQDNYFKITKALYLIIYILLENAVKFSVPGSEIRINFEEQTGSSIIVISNKTEKVLIEDKNLLLISGVRGKNAKTLGSGIGLSYAKSLAEGMKAKLSIDIEECSDNFDIFKVKIELNELV